MQHFGPDSSSTLESVLSPGQFSQPHLPGMHVKPMEQHRWPRGFTPERLDRVVRATETTPMSDSRPDPAAQPHNRFWRDQKFRRDVTDAVARSSVPVGDLQGIKRIDRLPGHEMANAAGMYFHNKPESWPGAGDAGPQIAISNSPSRARPGGEQTSDEMTLMHEIGHHAHRTGRTGEPGEWDDRAMSGKRFGPDPVLEGRAEAYGRATWRQDPRQARVNPRQFEANYDTGRTSGWGYDDERKFNVIYHGQPNKPLKPSDYSVEGPLNPLVGEWRPGIPRFKNDAPIYGQDRLFMRDAESKVTANERDYGQFPHYSMVDDEHEDDIERTPQGPNPVRRQDISSIQIGKGVPPADLRLPDVTPKQARQRRRG